MSAVRVLRASAVALGVVVLFVLALTGGVLLALDTPPGRRLVIKETNAILAPLFKGKITVRRLGHVGLRGVTGMDATVDDPSGRQVIAVKGGDVGMATFAFLRSALTGGRSPLTLRLTGAALESADVRFDTDREGRLDLVDAFAPSKPPSPDETPDPDARGFRLVLSRVTLGHLWAHGLIAGAPPLDANVDDLRGSLTYAPDAFETDVAGARIAAQHVANGADVAGRLQGHLRMPLGAQALPDVRVDWHGTVGNVAHTVRGSFAGGAIDAVVDVPAALPADVRSLWPASSMDRVARLHVEAHGPLAGVDVVAHASLGDAAFDARGQAVLEGDWGARVTFEGRHIDIHEIAASAPVSRWGLRGSAVATLPASGSLSARADVRFLGGPVGAKAAPPASVHAELARSRDGPLHGRADVVVEEPGAPTRVNAELTLRKGSSTLAFQVDSQVDDFEKVPLLAQGVAGSARLSASGLVDLTKETAQATLHAQAADVAQGATRAQTLSVEASARGTLPSPWVDVSVQGRNVVAGGVHLTSAAVRATGPATSPHVTASLRGPDTPDLDLQADARLEGGLSVQRLAADLACGDDRSRVTVRSATYRGQSLRIDGARVEGLGAPVTASLSLAPGAVHLQAATTGIDLARVGRLAHIAKRLQGGTLALDADLRLTRGAGRGRLEVDAEHLRTLESTDLSARADLSLTGRTIKGTVHADAATIGALDLNIPRATVAGSGPLTFGAWRATVGTADVDLHADLGRLTALVPVEDLPVSEARGTVALKAHVARGSTARLTPDLRFDIDTDGLVLAARVPTARDIDRVLVHPEPAWRLAGVDFTAHGEVDGPTGGVRLSTTMRDGRGELGTLDASSGHFPSDELLRGRGRFLADLETTDVDLHLAVPERGLGSLPPMLEQHEVTGKLQATVAVTGTPMQPRVEVTAALRHGGLAGNATTSPFDVDLTAHYDGRRATASVKAQSRGQDILDLEAQVEAATARWLEGAKTPGWSATARAHMASFPLQSIALLDDKLIAGNASGDVSLTGLHDDARLDADVSIDHLSVGSVPYRSAHLRVKADAHVAEGMVRIDQVDGFAEAKARAATSWGAALTPALDPSRPLDGDLTARNFRIASLMPFVDTTLDELDGRLDASTRVELDPRGKKANITGSLAVTRGTLEAAAGGGELHDLKASVTFAPDGVVRLEKLTASGMSGRLEASGEAHLRGLALQSSHVTITIPGRAPVPLTVAGSELGAVDGRVDVTATAGEGKGLAVKVDVPKLDVKVSESSTSTPQSLGALPDNVRVGAHRGDPARFVLLRLDPDGNAEASPEVAKAGPGVSVAAHLGDVHVVRGTQLKADLTGDVNVSGGKVKGQIQLRRGGTLDVQGRLFSIESGTVTFVDDPSNPEVVVKAGWAAPDGTVVYATFAGPLRTGKVTLSSQPQLSKEEIVQLLLFGSAEGKQAQSPSGSTQENAIATAGGEAAQPLNHMLNQLGLGAVTAKVDTSASANPKPEVEVQIAKDISLQIAVVLGQPPPGVNPDHTLLTVDWRFRSRWSVATTVGDAGTTIFDLLWQRRY